VASINALGKCRALKERCATRSRTCYWGKKNTEKCI
jgi:hypothetical protein